jgi:hypothetical protein
MSEPSPSILLAALQTIRRDLGGMRGVTAIWLDRIPTDGRPAVYVIGTTITPPPGFPPGIELRLPPNKTPYALPIIWKHQLAHVRQMTSATPEQDKPLDNDMWAGPTPVGETPLKLWTPEYGIAVGANQEEPLGGFPDKQLAITMRIPLFVAPNFWSKTFNRCSEVCIGLYATVYNVLTYKVPPDRCLIVEGVSYEFSDLVPFDQFDIRVLKNGSPMVNATWRDMRAPTTSVDPAEQYVFSGHYRPIKTYLRFDHDESFTIQVIVYGIAPFSKTPTDPLGGCAKVCTKGYLALLMDTRDGGARPSDMGALNDWALGDGTDALP